MKNKNLFLLLLTILCFIHHPLWAQNTQDAEINALQDDIQSAPQDETQSEMQDLAQGLAQGVGQAGRYVTEQRYVQQLFWIGDEYTSKYEVIIERDDGNGYKVILREFTEKATLEISLPPGNYRYRIIPYDYLDQSGEPSKWVTLEIKPPPVVPDEPQADKESGYNFYVSAAWSPLIPLQGSMQEVFENDFYFGGVAVHIGALYKKTNWWILPGAELSASWYNLSKSEDSNEIAIQAGTMGINLLAQIQLPKRMAVNAKAGIAIGFQAGEVDTQDYSYTTGSISPQVNFDVSFLWFAWKQFYLEAGVSYILFLNQNDYSGCLRPSIGAGVRF